MRAHGLPAARLRLGGWVWPTLAGLAGFAVVGGPVFLTGAVGWTGYTRIVDIAFQMDLAQHLAQAGRVIPPNQASSFNIVAAKLLGIGYPGGSQATLGVMAKLTRTNVAWCYQAFLAFTAAMGAMAIFSVLGRVTRNGAMRLLGAAVAIQPNILYGYTLEAGIKESDDDLAATGGRGGADQRPARLGPATGHDPAGGRRVRRVRRLQPRHRPVAGGAARGSVRGVAGQGTTPPPCAGELGGVRGRGNRAVDPGSGQRAQTVQRRQNRGRRRGGTGPGQPRRASIALGERRRVPDRRLPLPARPCDRQPRLRRARHRTRCARRARRRRAPALGHRADRRGRPDSPVLLRAAQQRVDRAQGIHGHGRVCADAGVLRRGGAADEQAPAAERRWLARGCCGGRGRAVRKRAHLPRHTAGSRSALPRSRGDRRPLRRQRTRAGRHLRRVRRVFPARRDGLDARQPGQPEAGSAPGSAHPAGRPELRLGSQPAQARPTSRAFP